MTLPVPGRSAMVALAIAVLAACGTTQVEQDVAEAGRVDHIDGSDIGVVTITSDAARRLDLQTAEVEQVGDLTKVPGGALIVDPEGGIWVYTSVEPLSFRRHPIRLARVEGDAAFLAEGPEAGTTVVSVGAAELYGVEAGIGH